MPGATIPYRRSTKWTSHPATGLSIEETRHGSLFCHVDTFSFEGPDFYPKFGYKVFGTFDYPPGHTRDKPLGFS